MADLKSDAPSCHESVRGIVTHVILRCAGVKCRIKRAPGEKISSIGVNGNVESAHVPQHVASSRVEPYEHPPRPEIILGQQWKLPRVRSKVSVSGGPQVPADHVVSCAAVERIPFKGKRKRQRDLDHRSHCVSFGSRNASIALHCRRERYASLNAKGDRLRMK